jgi:cation diffusion facilitator CzcD-associated flavoprotein CzcO
MICSSLHLPNDMMDTHPPRNQPDPLLEPIGIIGSGIAGLISAYVLLQDGFKNVEILTRDSSVGGVWSEERVYPGLQLNRSVSPRPCFLFSLSPM